LSFSGGTSHLTQSQYFDLEVATLAGDLQHIADADLPRGLGDLSV
jgi:hypothetical protein